ncbi:unnamed protein product, partial [Polarella glacialis]
YGASPVLPTGRPIQVVRDMQWRLAPALTTTVAPGPGAQHRGAPTPTVGVAPMWGNGLPGTPPLTSPCESTPAAELHYLAGGFIASAVNENSFMASAVNENGAKPWSDQGTRKFGID